MTTEDIAALREAFLSISVTADAAILWLDELSHGVGRPPRPLRPFRRQPAWYERAADTGELPNGASLKARRQALGVSQHYIAKIGHCSRGLIGDLESGRRRNPYSLRHYAATLTRLEAAA